MKKTSREEDRNGEFYMSNQHKERLYSYDNSQQVKDASPNKQICSYANQLIDKQVDTYAESMEEMAGQMV